MLAIKQSPDSRQVVPNLLPCTIKHNGPVPIKKRYWKPEAAEDGRRTAYLRGRKLRGREIQVPTGYQGMVLQKTEELLDTKLDIPHVPENEGDEDIDGEQPVEVKLMQPEGTFDRMIIWGHEAIPEANQQHIKGMEEWIGLAEAVSVDICHCELSQANSSRYIQVNERTLLKATATKENEMRYKIHLRGSDPSLSFR